MIRWDHHKYAIFINVMLVRLLVLDVYVRDQDIINDNDNSSTKIKVPLYALSSSCSKAYPSYYYIIHMEMSIN